MSYDVPYVAVRNRDYAEFCRRANWKVRIVMTFWGRRLFDRVHAQAMRTMAFERTFSWNSYKTTGNSEDWLQLLIDAVIAALSLSGGPWAPLISEAVKLIIRLLIQGLNEVTREQAFTGNIKAFEEQIKSWAVETRSF